MKRIFITIAFCFVISLQAQKNTPEIIAEDFTCKLLLGLAQNQDTMSMRYRDYWNIYIQELSTFYSDEMFLSMEKLPKIGQE